MKKIYLIIFLFITLLSSCASILNGKYQKVEILSNSKSLVVTEKDTINSIGDKKYKLRRDMEGAQVITKKDGYLDTYSGVLQVKRSKLYILSWIPFGYFIVTPFFDFGVKAFNYPKTYSVNNYQNTKEIPQKDIEEKFISINSVKIEIAAEDLSYTTQKHKKYIVNKKIKTKKIISSDEDIKIDNTIFDKQLNEILKEKGYIDTTNKVLKSSFTNKVYLNLVINSLEINEVYYRQSTNSFCYVNLNSTWEILDYYKQPIYSVTYETQSGEFVNNGGDKELRSFKNALEVGLSNLFHDKEFNKHFTDKSVLNAELNFETISLSTPTKKVTSLSESIKASVTISNKKGHGSGFFISNEGHIVTNYHVIIDTNDTKVVLNDGKEYDFEIIRTNKTNDLALIKINIKNEFAYELQKSEVELGLEIYAVGTPTGQDLQQSISKGIVSGLRNKGGGAKLIQTDASINGGNSGGAIILKNGKVVGVVSSKLVGIGIEGVAFGIPASEVFNALKLNFK
jgi:hypothetical protein